MTRWGLGAGVAIGQFPYAGHRTRVSPFPAFYLDNKWLTVSGTSVDFKIGNWNDVSLALTTKYALGDGYRASDAPILNGMENRRAGFWWGPPVEWNTPVGVPSASVLAGGNKELQADLGLSKSFGAGRISIVPYAGPGWYDHRYVNYYYGVKPSEARAGRAAYRGQSTITLNAGTRINYRLTRNQRSSADLNVTQHSGIANSPLVNKRRVVGVGLAYIYEF